MFNSFRSYWKNVANRIYDAVLSAFRTQEEIDEYIESEISDIANVVYDANDIPSDYTMRTRQFFSPDDLKKYISDIGLSDEYFYVLVLPDWDADGDTLYRLYVKG